jgi:uncharacterized protein
VTNATDQPSVIAALKSPATWPGSPGQIDMIETHAAFIFMVGNDVLKVKRAIHLPYLDFTTLKARRRVCEREFQLNAPHAPGLYHDVVAIRRHTDGSYVIGGNDGEIVEWAVRMARFEQDALLSNVCDRGALTPEMTKTLADRVLSYHRSAPPLASADDRTAEVARSVLQALEDCADRSVKVATVIVATGLKRQLAESAVIRTERAHRGCIRRCHGDLHLANIVLWQGAPMPFDALEFDEQLATIDILYDLAFLLMDLDRRGHRPAANLLLNRYLWRSGDILDLRGLAALPIFLGLRACVRAMVALDRLGLVAVDRAPTIAHVVQTLDHAAGFLQPAPPRLVAVGGLSGTGKTVLATALAPWIGAAPGALHLRTDLERKWLAGIDALERLPDAAYSDRATRATYERVTARAAAALAAGHSVVVDGVFSTLSERSAIAAIARHAQVPFQGLWLDAAPDVMRLRVSQRAGDASDATIDVVERQLAHAPRVTDWSHVDANGRADQVAARAQTVLGVSAATRG